MIEFKQPITALYETISIEIMAPGLGVVITSTLEGSCHLYVRVYNPLGYFIGEMVHGHYSFPTVLQFGGEMATLNAMMHDPIAGNYRFEFIVFQTKALEETCTCMISIETNICQPAFDDSLYIESAWFGPMSSYNQAEIIHSEARYYRGDLHGHTTFSDGKMTSREAIQALEDSKLDFMALTEHNRIPFGHKKCSALLIPAFELTLPNGHMNIWGVETPDVLSSLLACPENMLLKGTEVFKETAIISVNHPFMVPWAYEEKGNSISNIDTLEVICDPTYMDSPDANIRAAQFMDWLWEKGYTLFGVGGSDAHNQTWEHYENTIYPSLYGDPSTYVYCEGLSVENLKKGLRQGNCYVTRGLSLDIKIMNNTLLPGNAYNGILDQYQITVRWMDLGHVPERFEGRFIYNGKCIQIGLLTRENPIMILEKPVLIENEKDWIRFGIYDIKGEVVAYVNPVYSEKRRKRSESLGTLMEAFKHNDKGNTL